MIAFAKDYYDFAVEFLEKKPGQISDAWDDPRTHNAGGLFAMAATHRKRGCLTMIRRNTGEYCAETPELTLAIIADTRIPTSVHDINPCHLPVFAEWQRRLDCELNREPPVWKT